MDSCASVEREVDKFMSKMNTYSQSMSRNRIECEHLLDSTRKKIDADETAEVGQNLTKLKSVAQSIANDHKELHSTICKVGKSIDKNFVPQDGNLLNVGFLQDQNKKKMVHQVMCDYFIRQGNLEVAKSLIEEAQIPLTEEQKNLFSRVSYAVQELKNQNIEPCVMFVEDYEEQLIAISSSLEFYLLKIRFLELISSGKRMEALAMSSKLSKFSAKHSVEIQQLMGNLIFASTSNSSGSHISSGSLNENKLGHSDSETYNQLIEILTSDLSLLLDFGTRGSSKSHLTTCMEAGCQLLPSLVNLKQAMTQGKIGSLWNPRDELPLEINLKLCQYHSLVACPILRQPTNEDNPAMRLFCGHIISKEALSKISSSHGKLKCPYCPVEQSAKNALMVKF